MVTEMTIEELVNYLTDISSKSTIYGWVYRNAIPWHKPGKRLIFYTHEIDAWNLAGRPKNK